MLSHDLLWTWYYTLVCLFFPFWCHFFPVFFLESHGAVILVYLLLFFPIYFLVILHFLVQLLNAGFWFSENYRFFAWFTGWSSSGYASTTDTLRGYALVIGFDCAALFIWVPSWFTSWSFFWSPTWLAPSEVLLGVFIFWIYLLGYSMIPCVHALILLKCL